MTYKRNPIAIEDEADDYRRQEFEAKHTLRGRTSPCCDADVYIQTVRDFKERRTYDAVTCWNCHQIIEEV
ncbi:hypothetical protein EV294_101339 [Paenibacillus sp. BK033]|nr:hypothetical protein EV294_101339 [Paenibacillus sp. BK033]